MVKKHFGLMQYAVGGITKRPGAVYVCQASGPYLDPRKMPKHLNPASIYKWSAESNGKRHLKPV